MTSRTPDKVKYKCLCAEICNGGYCPGHSVEAVYSHTTDMLSFVFEDGHREAFDENKFKAMIAAYQAIKW